MELKSIKRLHLLLCLFCFALNEALDFNLIDILCDGNIHKIYSIPKDIYNEVMSFLNNRHSRALP